jgi:exodeoxyribonuclease VII large subunit
MDLIDDPQPGENTHEFTVSEISGAVKRMIEGEFAHIRIKGEVGRVSRPRSGHIYLDLKDDRAVLSGVIWKGVAARLATQPEEGIEVVATGRLTTFPGQSKYQIVIEDIRPAGVGALMAMLEKRKAQLQSEGLFETARKRPIPFLPEVIGVVTSPSGAVIRDILHRLRDRFPRKVLVWPVAVQGEKCAPEVTRAIEGFNRMTPGGSLPRPDLLIVARGGGSIEDLWGFNEENVARAAAASDIPLISAVGHETDTTLIDFVSDKRAPTPTAAAELAVPVRHDLLAWVDEQDARQSRAVSQGLKRRSQRIADLGRGLPRPEMLLNTPRQRLDKADQALPLHLRSVTQKKRARLTELAGAIRPATLRSASRDQRRALTTLSERHAAALGRLTSQKRRDLGRTDRLDVTRIRKVTQRSREEFDRVIGQLGGLGQNRIGRARDAIAALDRTRLTLGYEATLARGYAVVWDDDRLVPALTDIGSPGSLDIQFRDGRLPVKVADADPTGSPAKTKPKPKTPPPEQGSLF